MSYLKEFIKWLIGIPFAVIFGIWRMVAWFYYFKNIFDSSEENAWPWEWDWSVQ